MQESLNHLKTKSFLYCSKLSSCLQKNRINLQSLKNGFQTLVNGKEYPIAKIVIAVMASIAEMEKNRINTTALNYKKLLNMRSLIEVCGLKGLKPAVAKWRKNKEYETV